MFGCVTGLEGRFQLKWTLKSNKFELTNNFTSVFLENNEKKNSKALYWMQIFFWISKNHESIKQYRDQTLNFRFIIEYTIPYKKGFFSASSF